MLSELIVNSIQYFTDVQEKINNFPFITRIPLSNQIDDINCVREILISFRGLLLIPQRYKLAKDVIKCCPCRILSWIKQDNIKQFYDVPWLFIEAVSQFIQLTDTSILSETLGLQKPTKVIDILQDIVQFIAADSNFYSLNCTTGFIELSILNDFCDIDFPEHIEVPIELVGLLRSTILFFGGLYENNQSPFDGINLKNSFHLTYNNWVILIAYT